MGLQTTAGSSSGNVSLYLQVLCDTAKEQNETIVMNLDGLAAFGSHAVGPSSSCTVLLTERGGSLNVGSEYTFRLALGSNFDFINGTKLKDLYGEIYTFNPDVFAFKQSTNKPRWGMYGTFYSNRSISIPDVNVSAPGASLVRRNGFDEFVFLDFKEVGFENDSFTYQLDTVRSIANLQTDNIGFCLGALYNIRVHSPGNKFNLYVALHNELVRRYVTATYSYQTVGTATFRADTLAYPSVQRPDLLQVASSQMTAVTDYYLALGLPFWLHYTAVDLVVLPQAGTSWRVSRSDDAQQRHQWSWQPVYWGFKFVLIENQFGFTLGGDLKSYMFMREINKDASFHTSTLPQVNITLSKSFNLTHLGTLLGLP
jgi:hypothetical protein